MANWLQVGLPRPSRRRVKIRGCDSQLAIKDMTWPIGPNLAPGCFAATIKEEGQTRGCDRAIIGQDSMIWPKGHRGPEGAKLAIKIWCGGLAPTWSQVGIAATPMEEGHSLWL
ncbi:hypothetical protein O181_112292 [Austropuccinia psidii MF-1]|uniref:Uncharacterized protein n=1 Tax=Austropuccinia psidii MF-1 TaxID=1389203 RepID=A0A9Q3K1K1_9BASI|nr:hypothetical protein [Austropuccinia psidii MF-1]